MSVKRVINFDQFPDTYNSFPQTGLLRRIGVDTTDWAFDTTVTRWGVGKALKKVSGGASVVTTSSAKPVVINLEGSTHLIIGIAHRFATPGAIMMLADASGNCCAALILTDLGYVKVQGGAAIGSSDAPPTIATDNLSPLAPGTYNWIEWVISSAGTDVYVNNIRVIHSAVAIAKSAGGPDFTSVTDLVLLCSHNGSAGNCRTAEAGALIDDGYIIDSNDAVDPVVRLGDRRVSTFYGNSEAVNTSYTSVGGTNVADRLGASSDDGDTTGYTSSTLNAILIVGSGDSLPTTPAEVTAVQVSHISRKDAAADRRVTAELRISGTNYPADDEDVLTTTYGAYKQVYALNPATAAAWTKSTAESADFGLKVTT